MSRHNCGLNATVRARNQRSHIWSLSDITRDSIDRYQPCFEDSDFFAQSVERIFWVVVSSQGTSPNFLVDPGQSCADTVSKGERLSDPFPLGSAHDFYGERM